MITCIGIDVGLHGAVVALCGDRKRKREIQLLGMWDNPTVPVRRASHLPSVTGMRVLLDVIEGLAIPGRPILVGIEEQWERPGNRNTRASSVVRQYGLWEGLVAQRGWSYDCIPPDEWQSFMFLSPSRRRARTKALSRRKADDLLGTIANGKDFVITRNDQADAFLIAMYMLLVRSQIPSPH